MSDSTSSVSPAGDDSNGSDQVEDVESEDSQPGEYSKNDESAENKFPNEALAHVRVLDVGEPAREVARQLGLEIQSALPEPGERPVVLVVSEPSEVDTLLDVENRAWIGCVVAWQLPEESVERLYQLGVSIFVGLPDFSELLHAIEYLPDGADVVASRSFAARLATIEKLLTK
jgi:hypothetical protein